MREVELPNGSIGEFPDTMSDGAIAAVLSKQFPPPKSAASRVVDGALDAAKNLGTGLATGAGQLGTKILAPYDLAADAVQGRPMGTGNRERAASIESFGKDNADTGSINYMVGNAAPEMAATAVALPPTLVKGFKEAVKIYEVPWKETAAEPVVAAATAKPVEADSTLFIPRESTEIKK